MSLNALAPRPPSLLRILSVSALCSLFAALAWRQHAFVDANAVNILFWDQWDFYRPFFREGGLWDIFSQQHGPHRQGIGFLLTRVLAELSGWNVRWDSFAISFIMMAGALLALRLATRVGMKFGLGLAAIPLFFLNLRQYESFVSASNISHGAAPVLLFMVYCLAWLWQNHALRLATLSLLTFLLIFTGFGIFVGLLTPPLLAIELFHALRSKQAQRARWVAAALVSTLVAWALFAKGYRFDPAVAGFRFPYEKPMEYLYFVALMFTNFFGIPGHGAVAMTCGIAITSGVAGICVLHGWRLLRHGVDTYRVSVVLFALSGFTLLYAVNTAIGRVFLGYAEASTASRYVPLMIPGVLAILLQLGQIINTRVQTVLTSSLALITAAGTLVLTTSDRNSVDWYRKGRQTWKAVYLQTHNQDEANRIANFKIFPVPMDERIGYLEKYKLNLFTPEKQ